MRKLFTLVPLVLLCFAGLYAQRVSGKLNFLPGKTYTVVTTEKTTVAQEAMGQTIDFKTNGTVTALYSITGTSPNSTSLHHSVQRMTLSFDGMGSKKSYDTNNEKELNDEFGNALKELFRKTYDIEVNPFGKVILVTPGKKAMENLDGTTVPQLMRGYPFIYPPQQGDATFFKILPENEMAVGDSWTDAKNTEQEKSTTVYTINAITETTIIVNFTSTSTTTTKAQMMNMETTTEMTSNASGQITLDRSSGILKEKTATIEARGTTDVMGNKLPLTSSTTISSIVSITP